MDIVNLYNSSALYKTIVGFGSNDYKRKKNDSVVGGSGGSGNSLWSAVRYGNISSSLIAEKGSFMFSIFLVLGFQLLVLYKVAMNADPIQSTPMFWGIFIAILAIVFQIVGPTYSPFVKFMLFTILSILLGWISTVYQSVSKEVLTAAAYSTALLFGLLMVVGAVIYATGIQIPVYVFTLFFLLLFMLVLARIGLLVQLTTANGVTKENKMVQDWLAVAGVGIFSGYVVLDTYTIMALQIGRAHV